MRETHIQSFPVLVLINNLVLRFQLIRLKKCPSSEQSAAGIVICVLSGMPNEGGGAQVAEVIGLKNSDHVPARIRCLLNVDLMLSHRRRRWPNIQSILGQCVMGAGVGHSCFL